MDQPLIADKRPAVVKLKAGKYYWCSCGRSKSQPFCDGAHKGTQFQPKEFVLEAEKNVALCLCKHTKNPPFCDGAHSSL